MTGSVFGNIDLQGHRDWVEKACSQMNMNPILPLWEKDRETVMNEFLDAGFEAVVVCTEGNVMGQEWLGRSVNSEFIRDLKGLQKKFITKF